MSKAVTDQDFKSEILDFDGVAIVDFWAEWCTPCRVQGPIIDKLAEKYAKEGKVRIAKLDVDNNPKTQQQYHVMSIPTLIFYKNGEVAETFVGLRSEDDIDGKLQELLKD